ncbi:hypothetical protein AKO1_009086 [Acrasis kona]|uniref:Uncharacterized protein n=1 Tax=Acrasis kona TaxID=1008807 RepID=A0AAW2ZIP6_9EUKA
MLTRRYISSIRQFSRYANPLYSKSQKPYDKSNSDQSGNPSINKQSTQLGEQQSPTQGSTLKPKPVATTGADKDKPMNYFPDQGVESVHGKDKPVNKHEQPVPDTNQPKDNSIFDQSGNAQVNKQASQLDDKDKPMNYYPDLEEKDKNDKDKPLKMQEK